MLDLRRRHLLEQLAILPDRRVIGFHKAADILGKILIEPVADSDAAFAKVTGVIRAEKILKVLASLPCIHSEWIQSAGARPMCIDAAMIPVQKNAVLIFTCGIQQKNREIRFQRHGMCILRTDILWLETLSFALKMKRKLINIVWLQHDLVFYMAAAGAAPLALKRDFLIPGNRDDLFVHKTSYGKTAATKTVAAVGGSGGDQTGDRRRGFIHAATAIRIDAATAA